MSGYLSRLCIFEFCILAFLHSCIISSQFPSTCRSLGPFIARAVLMIEQPSRPDFPRPPDIIDTPPPDIKPVPPPDIPPPAGPPDLQPPPRPERGRAAPEI
jgi:hypothetical protein